VTSSDGCCLEGCGEVVIVGFLAMAVTHVEGWLALSPFWSVWRTDALSCCGKRAGRPQIPVRAWAALRLPGSLPP
jgi:hypothetical protein